MYLYCFDIFFKVKNIAKFKIKFQSRGVQDMYKYKEVELKGLNSQLIFKEQGCFI